MPTFDLLPTDYLLFLCVTLAALMFKLSLRKPIVSQAYQMLMQKPLAVISMLVLLVFIVIALLDSVHYKNSSEQSSRIVSTLDYLMSPLPEQHEKTYSAPFSSHLFVKEVNSTGQQFYPHLRYAAKGIHSGIDKQHDIIKRCFTGLVISVAVTAIVFLLSYLFWRMGGNGDQRLRVFYHHCKGYVFVTVWVLVFLITVSKLLSLNYHILGTGKIGQDIFYFTVKSIRTGLVIGLLTSLFMLPFALILGIAAGYFGGKVDDVIQYIYITLSSIPGVLLIAASVLTLQVFISTHAELFPSLLLRSDLRLLALCLILGVTSWTGLCRMLRAETLKIREIDYIQAAKTLGSSHKRIIFHHILPNLMHIVVIAVVLDFSFLVLAEAVLSYIGVGVSPLTISWGNMINGARLELAREPLVWWPMFSAFVFMFMLVLSVNIFADAIRDVFDPRRQ